jgi:hypothetical protein
VGHACTAPLVTLWSPARSSGLRGVLWTPPGRGHPRSNASGQRPAASAARARLLQTYGVPLQTPALDKVRKPRAGVSALVDVWWQRGWQDGQPPVALTPAGRQWLAEWWRPRMSWQAPRARPRCPRRQAKLVAAWEAVQTALARHPSPGPLAPAGRRGGDTWVSEHAKAFQRAASTVEGRNGYLSQRHHHHRGVPKGRSKVWTVLHNFDCRASAGTTPASRFFRRAFPDLFETVLAQIEGLPRPRRRNQARALSG